jgi:hypothetical protein
MFFFFSYPNNRKSNESIIFSGDMLCDFLKLVKKKSMKPKDDLVVELLGIQNVCIYKNSFTNSSSMEKCQSNVSKCKIWFGFSRCLYWHFKVPRHLLNILVTRFLSIRGNPVSDSICFCTHLYLILNFLSHLLKADFPHRTAYSEWT